MKITIYKTTQTHADTLLAVGVASLFAEAIEHSSQEPGDTQVLIQDEGPCFRIEGPDIDLTRLVDWRPSPGYPFIWDSKKESRPQFSPHWPVFDYRGEQEISSRQRDLQKQGRQIRTHAAQLQSELEMLAEGASPTYRLAAFMAVMRRGWESDKYLAKWLAHEPATAREAALQILRGNLAPPPTFPTLSASQMLTPVSGKGVHRSKPDSTKPDSISSELVNPLEVWMRLRGMFITLIPFRADDDFRVYCLVPGRMNVASLHRLHVELLKKELWGSLRLDIYALLELLRMLITNSDVVSDTVNAPIPMRNLRPAQVIEGLSLAVYKSLGTAHALMHSAFLNMPSWFPLRDNSDAQAYLDFVREAIGEAGRGGCLSTLREDNSSDIAALQVFRAWLTQGELMQLLDFLALYAAHTLGRRGRNEYATEWSTPVLEAILQRGYGVQTATIITNPGFASVARAIRNSTIYAAGLPDSKREVRYGLAQEWKQKIKGGPKAFIPVLADFVQQYNWETTHKLEGRGHTVTAGELDQLFSLIDDHGAELVGMLLLAYGFAHAPKAGGDEASE